MIFSSLHYNPEIRAAINIKYSKEILEVCREMKLEISSFDRTKEPENLSKLDWGTVEAIEKYGSVPKVIYDKGSIGKEPMIRLLGTNAIEVAKLAVELAGKIKE
jgi:hydroxymethylpyrimidine/phosphomethylpyrimidine kinase